MTNSDNSPPFLGAYLIVRDAEKTLRKLLESIEGAFDELVIVDTGSVDDTCSLINQMHRNRGDLLLPIKSYFFEWCDDFAAARQFAFSKGTAIWRGYLDADDVFPQAKRLRPTLKMITEREPRANALAMTYDYTPDGTCPQDVIRFVRWADGWHWQDEIHEHLVRTSGSRVIAKTDLRVEHLRAEGQAEKSLARNTRICEAIFLKAKEAGDRRKQGMMSYYLGLYCAHAERFGMASGYLRQAIDYLRGTNISCYALCELARISIRKEKLSEALTYSGQAIAAAPELADGYATMGICLTMLEAYERAILVFERLATLPRPELETVRDVAWIDGLSWAWAARAYVRTGRVDAAYQCLMKAADHRADNRVAPILTEVASEVMQAKGLVAFKNFLDFYLWSTEPIRAKLLFEILPRSISDLPQIGAMRAQLLAKLQHLTGWEQYQAAYASIPEDKYHTQDSFIERTLTYGRSEAVRCWAESLALEGPPVRVLSIGSQDGIIERPVLQANPRIHLTVCDVAPQAGERLQALMNDFPGRVSIHHVRESHYDWFPNGDHGEGKDGGLFDAIFLFEVLEHLPSDEAPLNAIMAHLERSGTLFLSTPVSNRWIEPHLTDPRLGPPWYFHVRSHNPSTLRDRFWFAGFTGDIYATETNGSVFLAVMKNEGFIDRNEMELSIVVPMGAPFDPISMTEGHLGGSEEAVVHLAEAMSRRGWRTTVFAPKPVRDPAIHVMRDVLWRLHTEFDPFAKTSHGRHILVWRNPQYAAQLRSQIQDPKVTVWNWLHDTNYNASKEDYAKVDGTFVLSKAHGEILNQLEGVDPACLNYVQNGIDPASFPELTDEIEAQRKLRKVIYASSPDRGLVYLLRMWPDVRKEVPDATLDIFYSWDGFRKRVENDHQFARDHRALLDELESLVVKLFPLGVTYHGGVSHPELHEAYRRSSIWAYPTDFYEISCISILKAQASGAYPIFFNYGALTETGLSGTEVDSGNFEAFRDTLIYRLKNPPATEYRRQMRKRVLREYPWSEAAEMFDRDWRFPSSKEQ